MCCLAMPLVSGLPFSTYAARVGGSLGGVKPPIHCVLHAKNGVVGPDSM